MDLKLEIVVLPVSDVDRAKEFWAGLGCREDADFTAGDGLRVVQMTPPGSLTSIIFGNAITDAAPGSNQGTQFVVDDITKAHDELAAKGVKVSEVFHDAGGVFHHGGTVGRVSGPNPDRSSYGSFLSFEDPDGNGFVIQEVTNRLPGRVNEVIYRSVGELESALRDAEAAHGKHEQETGQPDANWPAWYAQYMAKATGVVSD
jgi:catechol 2,3-dioxygenase-like lactoylglutathione lyase family enzyme